jgi:hypothetical protein
VAAATLDCEGSRKVHTGVKLELNFVNALSDLLPVFTSPVRKYVDVELCQFRLARFAELRTTLVSEPVLLTFARIPSRMPTRALPPRVSVLDP